MPLERYFRSLELLVHPCCFPSCRFTQAETRGTSGTVCLCRTFSRDSCSSFWGQCTVEKKEERGRGRRRDTGGEREIESQEEREEASQREIKYAARMNSAQFHTFRDLLSGFGFGFWGRQHCPTFQRFPIKSIGQSEQQKCDTHVSEKAKYV